MNEQTLKLLENPEEFVRRVAEQVVAERQAGPPEPEGFMSVKSASRYLDVPEDTIRKWLQRGHLTRHRVRGCVRVRLAELLGRR
jgi:excisionase family DNA binding protein